MFNNQNAPVTRGVFLLLQRRYILIKELFELLVGEYFIDEFKDSAPVFVFEFLNQF
jgi:hypothetical protein